MVLNTVRLLGVKGHSDLCFGVRDNNWIAVSLRVIVVTGFNPPFLLHTGFNGGFFHQGCLYVHMTSVCPRGRKMHQAKLMNSPTGVGKFCETKPYQIFLSRKSPSYSPHGIANNNLGPKVILEPQFLCAHSLDKLDNFHEKQQQSILHVYPWLNNEFPHPNSLILKPIS